MIDVGSDLLRAIRSCPYDDRLRLIYADHLEEQGYEANARVIRSQIEVFEMCVRAVEDSAGLDEDMVKSMLETCHVAFPGTTFRFNASLKKPVLQGWQMENERQFFAFGVWSVDIKIEQQNVISISSAEWDRGFILRFHRYVNAAWPDGMDLHRFF